jgi:hypothetical protein
MPIPSWWSLMRVTFPAHLVLDLTILILFGENYKFIMQLSPALMTGEIRCADHATPSIRKSWHYFANKRRSLGRHSSLADQSFFFLSLPPASYHVLSLLSTLLLHFLNVLFCFILFHTGRDEFCVTILFKHPAANSKRSAMFLMLMKTIGKNKHLN